MTLARSLTHPRHPVPRRLRAAAGLRRLCAALALAMLAIPTVFGQELLDPAEEYRLKAAFLFNFANFATWPDEGTTDALTVCVYGDDPFGAHLDALVGRKAGKHSLRVERMHSVDALDSCQVVFVTRPMIGNLARVLDRIQGRAVLTVADSPGALDTGVMLNMDSASGRISFAANLAAARRQGLGLSSRLLKLATEVRQ
ncbi:YfiR family protein [Thauera sp. JM12B12]|uniref:YfiR family protein n=1 Tax=Thauera sp. JM12B12 TaxID=3142262 RepID=UPI0031F390F8